MIKKLLALVLMTIAIIPAGVPPEQQWRKTHLAGWILFSKKWDGYYRQEQAGYFLDQARHNT
ncbi:MAG TPA: hypothetical protein VFY68_03310 [Nitrososphaeraceae archaeon]|nr:hypothetical protein [Nitrososphaeraceae archaeon]